MRNQGREQRIGTYTFACGLADVAPNFRYIPHMLYDTTDAEGRAEQSAVNSGAIVLEPPPQVIAGPPPPIDESQAAASADSAGSNRWFTVARLRGATGFLVSLIVHALLLLLLAFFLIHRPVPRSVTLVVSQSTDDSTTFDLIRVTGIDPTEPSLLAPQTSALDTVTPGIPTLVAPTAGGAVTPAARPDPASRNFLDSMLLPSFASVGGGLEGRDAEWRTRLLQARGGTPQSESAVEMGLNWLAAHQRSDGSWRFDLDGPCRGLCRHPGTVGTTTGATGLALLPFLGAGYTTEKGPHQEVIRKGLYYLTSRMLITPNGGDLQEGTMYAHGIATLALCEAYAMTGDEKLRVPAQAAVDFICHAQHERGGWRYVPGQPGDTTVFSWQIMALKSARLANLEVPSVVVENAMSYLDSVQSQDGAAYGYQKSGNEPAPTAIGLLARMYHGWRRSDPRLERGVSILESLGPSKHDVYFDYYATQVMHHYHGQGWDSWNTRMREHLIETQDMRGHERGSWHFPDKHGSFGGRLYTTAMAVMILEVYYRHMPMYGDNAVDVGF